MTKFYYRLAIGLAVILTGCGNHGGSTRDHPATAPAVEDSAQVAENPKGDPHYRLVNPEDSSAWVDTAAPATLAYNKLTAPLADEPDRDPVSNKTTPVSNSSSDPSDKAETDDLSVESHSSPTKVYMESFGANGELVERHLTWVGAVGSDGLPHGRGSVTTAGFEAGGIKLAPVTWYDVEMDHGNIVRVDYSSRRPNFQK